MPETDALLVDVVDFLAPSLTPYELKVYLYLLRHTRVRGELTVRIGIRSLIKGCGTGTRGAASAGGGKLGHFRDLLAALERKECITVGDKSKDGTLVTVRVPSEIPLAIEAMPRAADAAPPPDYVRDAALRRSLFERDGWSCRYCGERLAEDQATLDHITPQASRGASTPDNLATACHPCNSVKSGRTESDAAPFILASIRARRRRASATPAD